MSYVIGDKLTKTLKGLDIFEFTCVEVDGTNAWFICDEVVDMRMFNPIREMGNDYSTSDLKRYVDSLGVDGLIIPTKEQLEKWYSSDIDRRVRYRGNLAAYWTSSACPGSSDYVHEVDTGGYIGGDRVDIVRGIRPCFAIANSEPTTVTFYLDSLTGWKLGDESLSIALVDFEKTPPVRVFDVNGNSEWIMNKNSQAILFETDEYDLDANYTVVISCTNPDVRWAYVREMGGWSIVITSDPIPSDYENKIEMKRSQLPKIITFNLNS